MAAIGEKRTMEEYNVSDISETKKAKVHGVITQLSPVKTSKTSSRRYFDAHMSDGKKCVRVVSFKPSLKDALDSSLAEHTTIAMVNCRVQTEKGQDTNEHSTIEYSPKKFAIPDSHLSTQTTIQLGELSSLANNTTVSVKIKVVDLSTPETVSNKAGQTKTKQDCLIADESACARVVVWEKDVGELVIGCSYKLVSVGVRYFDGVNYLSVGGQSQIVAIEDIGDISTLESGDVDRMIISRIVEGEIVAVRCITYLGCTACKVKVQSVDGIVAECGKCGLMVKMSACRNFYTANIRVTDKNEKSYDLKMFHDIIMKKDCGDDDATTVQHLLLAMPQLQLRVDRKNVVFSVNKL